MLEAVTAARMLPIATVSDAQSPPSENGVDLFSLGARRLSWLEARQSVLARNVANADTPSYVPHDLAAFESNGQASVNITPVGVGGMTIGGESDSIVTRPSSEVSLDGNRVSLDHEMEQIADTSDQHHMAVNLYGKYMSMFQTVLGK